MFLEWKIHAGERAAAQIENTAEAIILYLACLRAGIVYVPLNTAYMPNEIEYFIKDVKPKLLVISPSSRSSLDKIVKRLDVRLETLGTHAQGSLMEQARNKSVGFINIDRSMDDIAVVHYTSGISGRAKGAMLTHGNLLSNALTLRDSWKVSRRDRLLNALSVNNTYCFFAATNLTLLSGATMIFLRGLGDDAIFMALPKASVILGVPNFYNRIVNDERLSAENTEHVRLCLSGSAPLNSETYVGFLKRTGHAILELYGTVETNVITSNPYEGGRAVGTVGYALPGISVRISDVDVGHVLPAGKFGLLEVKGPNVFAGYWNGSEKAALEFRSDGYFITGDVGIMEKDGRVSIITRNEGFFEPEGFNSSADGAVFRSDDIASNMHNGIVAFPITNRGHRVRGVVL